MSSYEDTLEENRSPEHSLLLRKLNDESFTNAPLKLRPTREELLAEFTVSREELTPMLEEEKLLEKSLVTQLPTQLPQMSVRLEQRTNDSPRLDSKSRSCCW